MTPFHSPAAHGGRLDPHRKVGPYGLVTASCLLAAAVLSGPGHAPGGADAEGAAAPQAMVAIGCHGEPLPEGGVQRVLVNTTAAPLPSGTRVAWSSSGTPRPAGELRVLLQGLAPGESVALRSDEPQRGGGCIASALHDGPRTWLLGEPLP